jgi:hypothetical protein
MDYGGDMIYLKFPEDELNPLNDEMVPFEPVGDITMSRMDLNMTQIPKYLKDVDVISENVGGGDWYSLDYQVDGEIGTEFYRQAGDAYESPVDKVPILESGVRNVSFRLRSYANDLHRPPVLRSFVAKMFGRSPYTRQWNLRVKIDRTTNNGTDVSWFKLHEVYRWLQITSQAAGGLTMHSKIPEMDDLQVIVEPPSIARTWIDKLMWGGSIVLTIREVG